MRRKPLYFAFAGLELLRYFILAYMARPLLASSLSSAPVLRLLTAPNILFAAGFFFMGLDRERYSVYQPLLVVGKAVTIFSAALALPGILGTLFTGASLGFSTWAIIPIILWDIAAVLVLMLWKDTETERSLPAAPEPELVETE